MSTAGESTQVHKHPATKADLAQWKMEGRDDCPVSFLTWGLGVMYVSQAAVNLEHTLDPDWRQEYLITIEEQKLVDLKAVLKFLNESINSIKERAGFAVDPNEVHHWAEYQRQFKEAVQNFAMNPTTPDEDKDRLLMLIVKVYYVWLSASISTKDEAHSTAAAENPAEKAAEEKKRAWSQEMESRKKELKNLYTEEKHRDYWLACFPASFRELLVKEWYRYLRGDLGPLLEGMDLSGPKEDA